MTDSSQAVTCCHMPGNNLSLWATHLLTGWEISDKFALIGNFWIFVMSSICLKILQSWRQKNKPLSLSAYWKVGSYSFSMAHSPLYLSNLTHFCVRAKLIQLIHLNFHFLSTVLNALWGRYDEPFLWKLTTCHRTRQCYYTWDN